MKKIVILSLFISSILLINIATALNDKYGIATHFWQANDWTDNAADLLVQSGTQWVRSDIPTVGPPYDYSWFIPDLQRAKNRGLKTLMIIWWPTPFDNLVEYDNYVAAVATQLKGYVDAYEILGEPLGHKYGWFHNDTPDQSDLPGKYFQMLKISYTKIKSIDPNAIIVGGGPPLTYGYDELWFWKIANDTSVSLTGKNITNYMDVFCLDPYDKPEWTSSEPAWSDIAIQDIKNRIINHKILFSPLPIWIAETGFSTISRSPSLCFQNNCDQSFMMNRILKTFNDIGATKIFWYELRDASDAIPDDEEGYYGLVDTNLNPKPSFNNFKIWTVGGYCDTLKLRIDQATISHCTYPKWDFIADVNKDRAVDTRDAMLWAINRYDESWCYGKLNDNVDACVYCADTDGDSYGSPNIFSQGTISGAVKSASGYVGYSYTDSCSGVNVIEYDCNDRDNKSSTKSCSTGYTCSSGRCQIITSPPRGCPILNVWDGNEFKEIELLNIHAPKDQDTTYSSTFSMQSKDGKYEIILHEAAYKFWDGSHIDSIKLVDSNEKECQLISAVHSKQGDVLQDLLYSDDRRVRTFPEEEIKLVYDGCTGTDFTFTVEGYNRKCGPYECGYFVFGYPLILIAPIISFVFVLLMLALYLLILSLLEKYKVI